MILMPDFVTEEVFIEAKNKAFIKKKDSLINNVKLTTIDSRFCCVYKHIGSYDNEYISFNLMREYLETTNYKRAELSHREIYLSDFRKTETDKLQTVLAFEIIEK